MLGCRKWGCNKWGLKGYLGALPGNRPKSAVFALFLPFSPFSVGCKEHLENPENGGKRNPHLRHSKINGSVLSFRSLVFLWGFKTCFEGEALGARLRKTAAKEREIPWARKCLPA